MRRDCRRLVVLESVLTMHQLTTDSSAPTVGSRSPVGIGQLASPWITLGAQADGDHSGFWVVVGG